MKKQIQRYAGVLLASAVVITGVASAAITPIPTISNTFAVSGQIIKSADLNKLASALNILDARTNGTAPTDPNHLADKEYVDTTVLAAGDWQKGKTCADGSLPQGYNADGTIKCQTTADLGLSGGSSGGLTSGSSVSLGGSIINNYLDFSLRTAADCDSATEAFVEVKAGSGNGYCIEKAERTGGQWEDAASTCINAGKRLPEPFEWKFACQNATALGLSNMTNNWEWASNFTLPMDNVSNSGVGAAVFGGGGCHFASWSWLGNSTGAESTYSFRCVR